MNIKELLSKIEYDVLKGSDNAEICEIAYDSRRITKKNSLFVCIQGFKEDGHRFIDDAIKNGATSILVEEEMEIESTDVNVIKVKNTRKVLSEISSIFYNEPSKELNLVGITGTNGKTSVSIIISNILENLGHKVGTIGTIDNRIGNKILEVEKNTPTTPESLELQMLLRKMAEEKVQDVIMEVSSMALELHRVDNCIFDIGVFTNLSQDHLDDHKTMENYKNAKLKLFTKCKYAIVNIDDNVSKDIINTATAEIFTYGINNNADLMAKDIRLSADGVRFKISFNKEEKDVVVKIPGLFSVYNSLAAIAVCLHLGLAVDDIILALQDIKTIRGRAEAINTEEGYTVIVDYAHSPDALENILTTVKGFVKGKVITVFGCGGDRDKTKRPIMGEIAGKNSQFCVITSDNPRTEEPLQILYNIEEGIKETQCLYEKILDRKEAIHFAMDSAKPGDVIVVAGKGHETYQILKDRTIKFDDMEVVKEYLKKKVDVK
ncbi:UDP-N-acetylmuramoyl-L-alanyl-D-glutamate--2,6-diaminopimelate ligase [Clostridium sp. UBA6640]|uniref:UDP-N-acetylmuramoyl-L-alanyl-D-glutamate--2, 6-diaminopimelate ligase n=1 Tax=Clostridium sp. UBA6640 TaxID=1946370 RepID=UPI0025C4410A|nr:UDP-N-acetylmuramoyl-L-alanyl-D-glutamate--2,6-diaminopimelate ligase [Clostridium sp. UBA6640]